MITAEIIANFLSEKSILASPNQVLDSVLSIDEAQQFTSSTLSWCNEKNIEKLQSCASGTIIIPENADITFLNNKVNYLFAKNPRWAFLKTISQFFAPPVNYSIHPSSIIDASVSLPNQISIGANVVIEENCILGNQCIIGANTVLKARTILKDNVTIGCNCTIGNYGFGYEKDETGNYISIPHLGNVILEKDVEIGNNTCIDRGVVGATLLKQNCKIDNLVHIAHGVVVGANSLVIANAMIGGSTIIGDNVWVAPSSTLINKISIGNNAVIGIGAVVLKPVGDGEIVVGNPAKKLNK
jgi:UDP-3-O-[3-hydroxymyristoyl] glucosamine N-acyltransferase